MVTNSNNQILLSEISNLNNQQNSIIFLECIQNQALMNSDHSDANSKIDLISDIESLVNVAGGSYDLAKFVAKIMRISNKIVPESIDMAFNPSLTSLAKASKLASKATDNSYKTAMRMKDAYNVVKFGKAGAKAIKGVPYLGSALDIGMIGATWKHSDTIAKSGGILGALMGIGGIIAAPFTFGGSLGLTIGGAAIGAGTSFM